MKIVYNIEAFNQLRREAHPLVLDKARQVRNKAGGRKRGYAVVAPKTVKRRGYARVYARGEQAAAENSRKNTLIKALYGLVES